MFYNSSLGTIVSSTLMSIRKRSMECIDSVGFTRATAHREARNGAGDGPIKSPNRDAVQKNNCVDTQPLLFYTFAAFPLSGTPGPTLSIGPDMKPQTHRAPTQRLDRPAANANDWSIAAHHRGWRVSVSRANDWKKDTYRRSPGNVCTTLASRPAFIQGTRNLPA
jgi:hypothetical protein